MVVGPSKGPDRNTVKVKKQHLVKYEPARIFVIGVKRTPGFVKLLLPPGRAGGSPYELGQAGQSENHANRESTKW